MSASTPSESAPIERLLTRADVAEILGVSSDSVSRIQAGGFAGRPPLRPVLKTTHVTRFRRSDLDAWIAWSPEPVARRGRGRPRKYNPATGK